MGPTWPWPFIVSKVVIALATCVKCTNRSIKVHVSCIEPHAFVMIVRGSRENSAQRGSLRMAQLSSDGSGSISISTHG